jgi:hypothetical protein
MLDNVKELAMGKAPAVRAGDQGLPQQETSRLITGTRCS